MLCCSGFEGGATNFLYRSKVDYATVPKTGMALVFDHSTLRFNCRAALS